MSSSSGEDVQWEVARSVSAVSSASELEPTDLKHDVVPHILDAVKKWNPPTLLPGTRSSYPLISDVDLFYDKHVSKKLALVRIKTAPSILHDICQLWPSRLSEIGHKLPGYADDDGLQEPLTFTRSPIISTSQSLCHYYQEATAALAEVVSSVLLHPGLEGWYSLFSWDGEASAHNQSMQDGYGLKVLPENQLRSFTREHLLANLNADELETLTAFRRSDAILGTWIVLPVGEESDRILREMKPGRFKTEILPSKGYNPATAHTKTLHDADIFPWLKKASVAISEPITQGPKRSTRLQAKQKQRAPLESKPSKAFPPGPKAPTITVPNMKKYNSYFREAGSANTVLQRGWTKAVENDSTFVVFYSGNYERIGVRHRGSRTLYLSEMIDTAHCVDPAYTDLHINLYMAIFQDAAIRLRLNEGQMDGSQQSFDQRSYLLRSKRRKSSSGETLSAPPRNLRQAEPVLFLTINQRSSLVLTFHDEHRVSSAPAVFIRKEPALHGEVQPILGTSPVDLGTQSTRYRPGDYISVEIFNKAGHGAIGIAHRAHVRLLSEPGSPDTWEAIVKFAFSEKQQRALMHEYSIYKRLSSSGITGVPSILGLYEDTMANGPMALVMSYGGDSIRDIYQLSTYHGVEQVEVPKYIRSKFSAALKSIHKAGVLHGDVRAPNMVVLENKIVQFIDFDRARLDPSENAQKQELYDLEMIFDKIYSGPSILSDSLTPQG